MARAVWLPEAERDLDEIIYHNAIKDGRPLTAHKVAEELYAKCKRYAESTNLGSDRSDLGEGCRVTAHKRWVIVFRPIKDGIEVMRIFDGSRDYPTLFS